MLERCYRTSSIDWKPSPIVALATIGDGTKVAAAREDGSLEIWLVSPGSIGWHCQLTIHGDPKSRISSLVWCGTSSNECSSGRLFSSSIDGSVSEWDVYNLNQKVVLESVGASIWQMALVTSETQKSNIEHVSESNGNGDVVDRDSDESSESDDDNPVEIHEQSLIQNPCIALACDDGCVRLYTVVDSHELTYLKSLPRVSGKALSVTWSPDGKLIYSGSSDGYIRCWDAKHGNELYRITVGHGGLGTGTDLCVWSLLALRCGVLVSADSMGSVQFWDVWHGTLLQAYSLHKGDAYALAAAPSHDMVYSAGSDGEVILYELSGNMSEASHEENLSSYVTSKWVYVGRKRAHTHDIRALTVAVPISREDLFPDKKLKRRRRKEKPVDYSYHKWAHVGVPMLLSGGDDTMIFAYSANQFTDFTPHNVCPAPQRALVHMVGNSIFNQMPLLLVQASNWVDILSLQLQNGITEKASGGYASTSLLSRVYSKGSNKITCSTISPSGSLFSYCNDIKLRLFELKSGEDKKNACIITKRHLPANLPCAHAMTFTSDSSWFIIAGHDRKIYIVDVGSAELVHVFTPCRKTQEEVFPPSEPPVTKLFTSPDGQWLAAANGFGDIYVFNMEIQRQHWFISRLDGASVTAGGFHPKNNNVLVLTTSSNQVYALDVEAKQLGEWSRENSFDLPRRFQEFPGEVIGLSFPPSASSSSVIIYSSRAMCLIDFGMPAERDDSSDVITNDKVNLLNSIAKKLINLNGCLKRKLQQSDLGVELHGRRNFIFHAFIHPVFFVGHISNNSLVVVDKPWSEVVNNLESKPVHRHIYGF